VGAFPLLFGGGGSQQIGGVKQTSDFLDKSTWALATLLLILILLSNVTIINNRAVQDSKLLDGGQTPIENTQSNDLPPVDQQ